MTCVICGASGNVEIGFIRWIEAQGVDDAGKPLIWASKPRCRDRDACHKRVTSAGRKWPIDDGRSMLRSSLAGASKDAAFPQSVTENGAERPPGVVILPPPVGRTERAPEPAHSLASSVEAKEGK